MAIYITLNEIREYSPCASGWSKLLKSLDKTLADDEPLALEQILDSNGLDDALWALRVVKGHDKALRLFACQCARLVLPLFEERYPEDGRPRKAIQAAEAFALGRVGKAELEKAYAAAYTAAADANASGAYTVCTAAYAATRASYAAYASHAAAYASHAAADAATYTSRAAAYAYADACAATTREEIEKLFLGMCSG